VACACALYKTVGLSIFELLKNLKEESAKTTEYEQQRMFGLRNPRTVHTTISANHRVRLAERSAREQSCCITVSQLRPLFTGKQFWRSR
jgi:hypothetical protein